MPQRSMIESSHQTWKVNAAMAALVLAGIGAVVSFAGPRQARLGADLVLFCSGFMSMGFVRSVRCPKCRKSLGWWAFRHSRLDRWREDLESLTSCPLCGFRDADVP